MKNMQQISTLCLTLFLCNIMQAQTIAVSPDISMCNSSAVTNEVVTFTGDYKTASGATWSAPAGATGALATPVEDGAGGTSIDYTLGAADAGTTLVFTLTNNDNGADIATVSVTVKQCPILSIATPAPSSIMVGSTFDVATLVTGDLAGTDTYYATLADAQVEASAIPSAQTITTPTSFFVRRDVPYTDPIAGNFVCTAIEEIVVQAAALPLELLSFTGHTTLQNNVLNWTTATEENTAYFVIERSTNGTDFAPIGDKILAAGNSTTNKYYELIDEKPLLKGFYRLRMVDVDGAFSYSTSVLLQRKRGAGVVSIAPNPATQNAVVTYEMETAGTVTFNVIDALGRIAQTQTTQAAAGTNQETLYIAQLPSAVYSIQVLQNNTVSQVVKLSVAK